MMESKANLRALLKNRRQAFVKQRTMPGDCDVILPVALRQMIENVTSVAVYAAIGSEADPASITAFARQSGAHIALPFLSAPGEAMTFKLWNEGDPLEIAAFGVQQPSASSPDIAPDIIIAPLVGFDRSLNRLGQGGGHYDGAFTRYPNALRIGLAYSIQEMPAVPLDPWDVPLHAILTEKEWITPQ